MNNIRLLHLMKTFDVGGVERSTITYSNKLISLVESVSIFAKRGRFNHSNIINRNVRMFFSFSSISNPIASLLNLARIVSIILKYEINIIHYHQRIYIPYIIFIKLFFPKIKLVYTHHSVFNDKLNRLLIADLFIAISNATKLELESFSKSNIILLKHGIEIEHALFENNSKIKNIGFVGRFDKTKGILVLLEAFNELNKNYSGINLLLIGEGKNKPLLINFINHNSLEKRVIIKEPLTCLNDIYRELDCLVLPSIEHEGFGLVLVEAMNFGIPVISSDLESLKEIVIHDKTGLLFEKENFNSLKSQLIRIIEDEKLKKILVENSKKNLKEYYDLKLWAVKYLGKIIELA